MALRTCTVHGCPELTDQSRCPAHRREVSRAKVPRPARAEHRRVRTALLPDAINRACPICGLAMLAGQALDLDHSLPVVLGNRGPGDRMAHATCNRSEGGRLGNQIGRIA